MVEQSYKNNIISTMQMLPKLLYSYDNKQIHKTFTLRKQVCVCPLQCFSKTSILKIKIISAKDKIRIEEIPL